MPIAIRPKARKRERRTEYTGPIRCPPHLGWIRKRACILDGRHDCGGKIEAAHVRIGTDGGTSLKPGDNFTNPLCSDGHALQHRIGERAFEKMYDIDLKATALLHWAQSPHRLRYERTLEDA